jgi:hypothetical protein
VRIGELPRGGEYFAGLANIDDPSESSVPVNDVKCRIVNEPAIRCGHPDYTEHNERST